MDRSLYEQLKQDLNRLPMHMPGHKRNAGLAPYLAGLGAALDISEIEGFDNLQRPEGLLKNTAALAARLYGADRSFPLVGGSTAGILAGMRALSRAGDTILMQRASHMSVYHAVALCGLKPVYLCAPLIEGFDSEASLEPEALQAALTAHPEAKLLVLTSPNYAGVMQDLSALCAMAKSAGLRVLVDAAHGAHLGLSPHFPQGAVGSGADIVVHSLHKTLPSLTQTALAHATSAEAASRLEEELRVFQSSSPSYLLLASIDGCLRLIDQRGEALFAGWRQAIDRFYQAVNPLRHLKLLGKGASVPDVHDLDPSKLLISSAWSDLSGWELMERLRLEHGIELEMASESAALAMTGMGDDEATLMRLAEALLDIDSRLTSGSRPAPLGLPQPEIALLPHEARALPWRACPWEEALGQVAAEYVWVYPPGIPLLAPGERMSAELIEALWAAPRLSQSRSGGRADWVAVIDGGRDMSKL